MVYKKLCSQTIEKWQFTVELEVAPTQDQRTQHYKQAGSQQALH